MHIIVDSELTATDVVWEIMNPFAMLQVNKTKYTEAFTQTSVRRVGHELATVIDSCMPRATGEEG